MKTECKPQEKPSFGTKYPRLLLKDKRHNWRGKYDVHFEMEPYLGNPESVDSFTEQTGCLSTVIKNGVNK